CHLRRGRPVVGARPARIQSAVYPPGLTAKDSYMTVSLTPLGDRVVVKAKPKDAMTLSGIVLPDTATEKPQEGAVLSVGPGRVLDNGKRVDMEVKAGDT